MGTISEVRDIIAANTGKERSEIVSLVVEKLGCKRAMAHSYVYHAQKKSAKTTAEKPMKAVAAKKAPAKKAEPKKDVAAIKAKNLETLKKVGSKKKAKATEAVESDLNPQLIREEVDQMIAEIDSVGFKALTPKFMHKDFDGLDLSEV